MNAVSYNVQNRVRGSCEFKDDVIPCIVMMYILMCIQALKRSVWKFVTYTYIRTYMRVDNT